MSRRSTRTSRTSRTSRTTPASPISQIILPKQREIWWASGSVELAVLEAAASAGSAPLSIATRRKLTDLCSIARSMFSLSDEGTFLSRDGKHLKVRPCIVRRISDDLAPDGGLMVTAFVLATYGGTPITGLPDLTRHFAVSVGDTEPWPSPDAAVIKPSPDWPKSRDTPVYLIAHPVDIPLSSFVSKYTLGPAQPGGKDLGPCSLTAQQQYLLEVVVRQRRESYKGKSFKELIAWNDSWEVHHRERQERLSQTGPLSERAGTNNPPSQARVWAPRRDVRIHATHGWRPEIAFNQMILVPSPVENRENELNLTLRTRYISGELVVVVEVHRG
ncbi:hypothetical protein AURDEDRAFT_171581 [Auricularia subglabra TFB-10046 SS5]|nr:hypothetical protein AURDEDRAFT_171581 [Auricularia subglabra TFB-10046 SS5]